MADTYFSKEQHQEISTKLILSLRDNLQARIEQGDLDGVAMCGKYAKMFDNLVWCYFDHDREECGISHLSSLTSLNDVILFVDEQILPVIHAHREDILNVNWQGRWELKEESSLF